jgi:hypothetical protein
MRYQSSRTHELRISLGRKLNVPSFVSMALVTALVGGCSNSDEAVVILESSIAPARIQDLPSAQPVPTSALASVALGKVAFYSSIDLYKANKETRSEITARVSLCGYNPIETSGELQYDPYI